MGNRLKSYREGASLSVISVAEALKIHRSTINGIESGKINFSINLFAKLLSHYGTDLGEFLRGFQMSDIPDEDLACHDMLNQILRSGIKEQVQGIRINLEAISEKVARLLKARDSPNPAMGEGKDSTVGSAAGRRQKQKHK